MKAKYLVPASLLVFGSIGGAVSAIANSQETTEAAMPVAKPTPMHAMLAAAVGEWNAEVKIFMPGGAPPMVSAGSDRVEMLGDLWQISRFEGEMMGQKFKGQSTMGYDTDKEKFVGVWTDTVSAHMTLMEGTYDEATKTLTSAVTGRNPMTGQATKEKHVWKYPDANTRILEMHMPNPMGGEELVKTMEITYTRK